LLLENGLPQINCENLRQILYLDAARCVATLFEQWNCVIENSLPARRKKTLYAPFAAVSIHSTISS